MTCGLAIFVKTPGLSAIKTRLAQGIGAAKAQQFYLLSAQAVASVARQAQQSLDLAAYWAVAEPAALDGDAWADLPRLGQGEGSLGERMAQVYRSLLAQHDGALLIGADAPQLDVRALARAVQWLAPPSPRLVIGRAADGGFWLFGGNCPLPNQAWMQAAYSVPDTSIRFSEAMRPFGDWLELESLSDVDHAHDLPTVESQLHALNTPTTAQQRLAQWLAGLSPSSLSAP